MAERIPRDRFRRHDYKREIINHGQIPAPRPAPVPKPLIPQQPTTKRTRQFALLLPVLVLFLIVVGFGISFYGHQNNSPVPKAISRSVNFPIYYPDSKKLPEGYTLNLNSFKVPIKDGVTYTISYGNSKQIVFSIQSKPSASELQTFASNYLPLRTPYQTSVGQAEIGAYNLKTLVSLPTTSSTWIIITAPPDINQSQLEQVLSSIKD